MRCMVLWMMIRLLESGAGWRLYGLRTGDALFIYKAGALVKKRGGSAGGFAELAGGEEVAV